MMTLAQQNTMNTELWQSIGYIADDDALMRRLTRYAKKLAKEKDPTLMTKEEFFARVDAAKNGPTYELQEGETIEDLLKRVG
jgi:ribonucleotide reductase beta subunit family protein with ferritin-like domain